MVSRDLMYCLILLCDFLLYYKIIISLILMASSLPLRGVHAISSFQIAASSLMQIVFSFEYMSDVFPQPLVQI